MYMLSGLGLKAVWLGAEQFGNVIGLTKPKDPASKKTTTDQVSSNISVHYKGRLSAAALHSVHRAVLARQRQLPCLSVHVPAIFVSLRCRLVPGHVVQAGCYCSHQEGL